MSPLQRRRYREEHRRCHWGGQRWKHPVDVAMIKNAGSNLVQPPPTTPGHPPRTAPATRGSPQPHTAAPTCGIAALSPSGRAILHRPTQDSRTWDPPHTASRPSPLWVYLLFPFSTFFFFPSPPYNTKHWHPTSLLGLIKYPQSFKRKLGFFPVSTSSLPSCCPVPIQLHHSRFGQMYCHCLLSLIHGIFHFFH